MRKLMVSFSIVCSLLMMTAVQAESLRSMVKKEAKQLLERNNQHGERMCDIGSQGTFYNTIIGVTEFGQVNGLQPGDTILSLNEKKITRDNYLGSFDRYKPGDEIRLNIRRKGESDALALTFTCGDGTEKQRATIEMAQAAAKGKWQECIDQSYAVDRLNEGPTPFMARWRRSCNEARRCGRFSCKDPSSYDAQLIFEFHVLEIETASRGEFLNERRGNVLSGVTWLEKNNFGRFARDLESRLREADRLDRPSPPPPAPLVPQPRQVAFGTCFAVSPNEVLTSHHVVADAEVVTIQFDNENEIGAVVTQQSRATDLALLQINGRTPAILPLAPLRSLEVGDAVFTLGFPATSILGDAAKFTEGSVSSLSGIHGDASYFQMSVPIQPGNSGGPVVNMKGEVVGVVAATAAVQAFYSATGALPQNVNWASKSDYARILFAAPSGQLESPEKNREKAIRSVRAALCRVKAG